jgi:hypothetical protein
MVIGPLFLWLQRGVWQPQAFMAKLRELRGASPDDGASASEAQAAIKPGSPGE